MACLDVLSLPGLEPDWVVITVKQPWAALIIAGLKPVENRSWSTRHRGRLHIHAAARDDRDAWASLTEAEHAAVADLGPVARSAIIGSVDLVDVVRDEVMAVVKASFRPEFLNRIDETVVFHGLDAKHIEAIAAIQIRVLQERLKV